MIVPPSGAWNGRPGRQRIAHTMRTAAIPRSPPFKALRSRSVIGVYSSFGLIPEVPRFSLLRRGSTTFRLTKAQRKVVIKVETNMKYHPMTGLAV